MALRETGYAKTPDETYIAYQTIGEGPIDLVYQFDWFGNVDAIWEDPDLASIFGGLASFSRLILHDRRGTGLSSRSVPVPNLETRIEDLCVVLERSARERPVLGGEREGGAPNLLLAATDPQRVRSLFWYSPSARSTRAPRNPRRTVPGRDSGGRSDLGIHRGARDCRSHRRAPEPRSGRSEQLLERLADDRVEVRTEGRTTDPGSLAQLPVATIVDRRHGPSVRRLPGQLLAEPGLLTR
jgi:pimeloyl-ACP methyl ester carboxylesterase